MSIAPCGINCSLCAGFQRKKAPCSGCNSSEYKPTYCQTCIIKHCPNLAVDSIGSCIKCNQYPCKRLKQLEKRYRVKYGVNIYENLQTIENRGIIEFLENEKEKWTCKRCGNLLCMHNKVCKTCNKENPYYIGTAK